MTKSFSEEEIKAHLSESIDLAIEEGFVTITLYGKPVAAIVNIENLEQIQRIRAVRLAVGLANVAQDWDDADEFAQELDKVVRDR